ncbi:MAG: hypothetical protein WBB37_07815 [bacterium]
MMLRYLQHTTALILAKPIPDPLGRTPLTGQTITALGPIPSLPPVIGRLRNT